MRKKTKNNEREKNMKTMTKEQKIEEAYARLDKQIDSIYKLRGLDRYFDMNSFRALKFVVKEAKKARERALDGDKAALAYYCGALDQIDVLIAQTWDGFFQDRELVPDRSEQER